MHVRLKFHTVIIRDDATLMLFCSSYIPFGALYFSVCPKLKAAPTI